MAQSRIVSSLMSKTARRVSRLLSFEAPCTSEKFSQVNQLHVSGRTTGLEMASVIVIVHVLLPAMFYPNFIILPTS